MRIYPTKLLGMNIYLKEERSRKEYAPEEHCSELLHKRIKKILLEFGLNNKQNNLSWKPQKMILT